MPETSRRERPEQLVEDAVAVLDQVLIEVSEPRALSRLHVVGGERVVERRPPFGTQRLADHDLDQARRLPMRRRSSSVSERSMTNGFMPCPGTPGESTRPRRLAPCPRIRPRDQSHRLSLRGRSTQNTELRGERFAAAGSGPGLRCWRSGVCRRTGRRRLGMTTAGRSRESAAAGVEVGRREGEETRQRRRVQRSPLGDRIEPERQGRYEALALPERERVELAQCCREMGTRSVGGVLEFRPPSTACNVMESDE